MHGREIHERAIELRGKMRDGRYPSPATISALLWRETGLAISESTIRAWIDPEFAERERQRKAEWARANDSPERRRRKNAQQRQRYATDPDYRAERRKTFRIRKREQQ